MTAVNNARWIATSQAGRVVTQLVGVAVLARMLLPADYGLMAMAGAVIVFAGMLRDMGTGAAIIQKEDLADATINAVFWLNLAMGLGIAVLLVLLAPLIALAFRIDALVPVLCALAPVFPLTSSVTAQQALLERQSAFRMLAAIEISSAVVALLLAIVAASNDFGVYSLVIQSVAGSVLSSAPIWFLSKWRPSWRVDWSELRALWGFSGHLAGFNFINYVSRNADTLIIARFLGASSLGVYSLAYKLMMFPLQNLTAVAARALFPVMSRKQHAVPEMAALYLRTLRVVAMFSAPLSAGLLMLREPVVALLFGPQWGQTADVLAWLAPTSFLQSLVSTVGTVFVARGRTDVLMRIGAVSLLLISTGLLIGSQFDVVAVAFCYFIVNIVNAPICLLPALRQLHVPARQMLAAIAAPVGGAAVMIALLYAFDTWVDWPAALWKAKLAASSAVALIGYMLALLLVFKGDVHDVVQLLRPDKS